MLVFDMFVKTAREKMRKAYYDCKFFKSTGNAFGGCKHPNATGACIYEYTDECRIGEGRIVQNREILGHNDKRRYADKEDFRQYCTEWQTNPLAQQNICVRDGKKDN